MSTSDTTTEMADAEFGDSLEFVKTAIDHLVRQAESAPIDLPRMVDHPDHIPLLREVVLTKVTSPDCERRRCISRSTLSKRRIEHLYPRCKLAKCPHCAPHWIAKTMRDVFSQVGDQTVYRYAMSRAVYKSDSVGKRRRSAIRNAGGSWVTVSVGHDDVEFFATHNTDGKGEPVEAAPAILDALLRAPLRAVDGKRVQPVSFPKPRRAESSTEATAARSDNVVPFPGTRLGPEADRPDVLCRYFPSYSTIEGVHERWVDALGYEPGYRHAMNRRGGSYSQRARYDNVSADAWDVYERTFAPLFHEALQELDAGLLARQAKALYSQFEMFKQAYPQQRQAG